MTREEAIKLLLESKDNNIERSIREWEEWDKKYFDAIDMAIRGLEAWEKLYEETAEWEAQALDEVRKHIHDEDASEWRRWSHILNERTAFKFDVFQHLKEVEDDKRRSD